MSRGRRLLLIDGNSLLHRAYHAYPNLGLEGKPIGAVYGFSRMLLAIFAKLKLTHVAVAWDVGKIVFRHEEYEGYKAGRPEMDQELIDQLDKVKEVVTAFNIPQFGVEKYEADDVIGTIVAKVLKQGSKEDEVVIMTGDRDALQLVKDKKVMVYMPAMGLSKFVKTKGDSLLDEEAVVAKYGLKPEQIIDLKALMGDASDNIAGVVGVGKVTATKLLRQQGSVEKIYENLDKLEASERVKSLLKEGREAAFMSKRLVTIYRQVPIKFSWEACKLADYDREKVLVLFEGLRFKSLVDKLPEDNWEKGVEEVFV